MNTHRRGFTLLEVLIAMGLFTVIGFAVVLLMRTGVDMWLMGNRGSQTEDRLEQSLPRFEEDLRMVRIPDQRDSIPFDPKNPDPDKEPEARIPANRFLSSYVSYKFGEKETRCRYVAFVRDITGFGEVGTYAQRAGTNPKADAYIDGKDDEAEFAANRHLPHGGAIEVLWIWMPDENRPGVGSVYRAYRTPIGGPETLLDPANFDSPEKLTRGLRAQPIFQNVLLFDVLFWTQYTTHWEWSKGEPSVVARPTDAAQLKAGRPPCGPSRTWDSTRGLLPAGEEGFRLSKGARSARFSADDIWPRMVRIEFAIDEENTTLTSAIGASDISFSVDAVGFATGRGEIDNVLFKVGLEWLIVGGRDATRRDTFSIGARGQRGTPALAHAAGERVYFGRVFDFTVSVPSFRDDNN